MKANNSISVRTSKNISVTVICPIRGMVLQTQPPVADDGLLYLEGGTEMSLEIRLEAGSFVNYTIEWGDKKEDFIDHSDERYNIPEVVTLSHTYEKHNNTDQVKYTITVYAKNELQKEDTTVKKSITVLVLQCSIPLVTLSGSTSQNTPAQTTTGMDYTITATYDKLTVACRNMVLFNFTKWSMFLLDANGNRNREIINGTVGNLIKGNLKFTLKKRTQPTGTYSITLSMYWENKYKYINNTVYIEVIQIPITAVISGGTYRQIGWKKLIGEKRYFYNFTLDGTTSYDPDETLSHRRDNITLRWKCRISPSTSDKTIENSRKAHPHKDDYCSSQDKFENLNLTVAYYGEDVGILKLNTSNFLENVTYEFQLIAAKYGRSGNTTQSVTFIPGSPPVIELV